MDKLEMLLIADKLDALSQRIIAEGRLSWDTLKLGYGADELRRIAARTPAKHEDK